MGGGTSFQISVFLLGLAWIIARAIHHAIRRARERVAEPACAACRYPVRGLAALTCPECGADLRSVGILTPRTRTARPISLATKAVLWTLLIVLFGSAATSRLASAPALRWTQFTGSQTYTPTSGEYARLTIEVHGEHRGAAPLIGAVRRATVTLTRADDSSVRLAAERRGDELIVREVSPPTPHIGSPLSAEVLGAWMFAAGVSEPAVRMEASYLDPVLSGLALTPTTALNSAVPAFTVSGSSWNSHTTPIPWIRGASIACWVIVWGAGLWVLARTRRPAPPLSAAAPPREAAATA